MQAAAHLVQTDNDGERFWLTTAQARVLSSETGAKAPPTAMVPLCNLILACGTNRTRLPECVRTGRGLKWDEYGMPVMCAVCHWLGTWTAQCLTSKLKTIPGALPLPPPPHGGLVLNHACC
jgi:hypothetical protein